MKVSRGLTALALVFSCSAHGQEMMNLLNHVESQPTVFEVMAGTLGSMPVDVPPGKSAKIEAVGRLQAQALVRWNIAGRIIYHSESPVAVFNAKEPVIVVTVHVRFKSTMYGPEIESQSVQLVEGHPGDCPSGKFICLKGDTHEALHPMGAVQLDFLKATIQTTDEKYKQELNLADDLASLAYTPYIVNTTVGRVKLPSMTLQRFGGSFEAHELRSPRDGIFYEAVHR